MAPPDPSPGVDRRASALQRVLADANQALAWFAQDGYARIEEQYQRLLAGYEQVLHDVNVSPEIRDRACHAVDVCQKFLRIREVFAQQKRHAELELEHLKTEALTPEQTTSRLTSFMR